MDSPDPLAGGNDDITWMPPGDTEHVGKIAYAFINIDRPSNNPAPFIYAALFSAAPMLHCRLHTSSRGNMMLHFGSRGDRDAVVDLSPIIHDGTRLSLERADETSNRFTIEQQCLVAVSAIDFLEEHWDLEGILAGFHKLGTVIDIDPACLGDDHFVLRVVWHGTQQPGSRTTSTSGTWVATLAGSRWAVPSPKVLRISPRAE